MTERRFAQNLGYLCSRYPSVAEVCRQLGMNRQQFNKYLSGQLRPSQRNLRRICEFFGVDEADILLDHHRFVATVSPAAGAAADESLAIPLRHLDALYAASQDLERYLGYYFRYYFSFGHPGRIVKSLASLSEKDGRYYWKNIEIRRRGTPGLSSITTKYCGIALFLGERIFIVEYDSMLKNAVAQITLYPCYHPRLTHLRGVQTGAPMTRGRKPSASLVLMEYLGQRIHLRDALRSAGIYAADDPAIDTEVRRLIANEIPGDSSVLEADEI